MNNLKTMYAIFMFPVFLLACSLSTSVSTSSIETTNTVTVLIPSPFATDTPTFTSAPPTETFTPTLAPTDIPTSTSTSIPVVESLKASVTADLLSCRYGPGSEYLYLYGLKKGANIQIIGRTDGNNWVLVSGKNKCWVNAKFIEVHGDQQALNVMYPAGYELPVSPYYSPATVLSAVRDPNNINLVTVKWTDITLTAGDEEDENMFIYIIEIWRCENGKMIFDPLASNFPEVTFVDEAGCDYPSHGRVYFQEKHGYAGPAEIPWPIIK